MPLPSATVLHAISSRGMMAGFCLLEANVVTRLPASARGHNIQMVDTERRATARPWPAEAHLNYPATLNSFRSCLKVIDTFRSAHSSRSISFGTLSA